MRSSLIFRSFRCTFHGVQNRSLRLYNAPPPFSHSHETCGLRLASIFKRDFAKKDFFHDFFNLLSICTFGKFWKVPLLNTSVYLGTSGLGLVYSFCFSCLHGSVFLSRVNNGGKMTQMSPQSLNILKIQIQLISTYFNLLKTQNKIYQNILPLSL